MGYINPKSVIAVGTILPSLAAIAVALRFYARRRLDARIGSDDLLVLFALVGHDSLFTLKGRLTGLFYV